MTKVPEAKTCPASVLVKWLNDQVGYKATGKKDKYALDIDTNYPDFYNGKKYGVADWCDVMYDDGMINCYGEQNAFRLTCQPKKSSGAGVKYSARYYRAKNKWLKAGKTPSPGDQIFFGKEGDEYHTGGVVKVEGGKVYTVEGNTTGGLVRARSYSLKSTKIAGYGTPDFDPEPSPTPTPTPPEPTPTPSPIAPATCFSVSDKGTYKCTANELNVRSDADTSKKNVLAVLKKGDKVTCYGYSKKDKSGNKWLCIRTSKGVEGYSCAKYLTKV